MALTKVNTDLLADGGKLNGIEAGADVTDTTNVTAAGALMDSELTSIASVKALDQGVATTDSPTFAGLTASGEITANGGIALGDNDKATFGAGDDLQIYHTGSYSAIADVGTGAFYIGGADFVDIGNSTLSETSARFHVNDRVDLYHNNAIKLATTSTGIDVTGDANTSGLLKVGTNDTEYANNYIRFKPTGAAYIDHSTVGQAINFRLSNASSLDKTVMTLSSAGNVGIGVVPEAWTYFSPIQAKRSSFAGSDGQTGVGYNWYFDGAYKYIANDYALAYQQNASSGVHSWSTAASGTADASISWSERMRIDESGSVGIGTSSPSASKFSSTPDGVLNVSGNKPVVYLTEEDETDSNVWMGLSNEVGIIGNTGDGIAFRTGASTATEAMRIDSSGNVGIGTSSPASPTGFGSSGILHLKGGTGNDCSIVLEGLSGSGGRQEIGASGGALQFYRGAATGSMTESMRIDSSGRVLVGKTAVDNTTVGFRFDGSSGFSSFVRDGGEPLYLNRKTSDGDILKFAKDGTAVGSIGTNVGRLTIGSGDTGVIFASDIDAIYPANGLSARDNAIDIGSTGARFKDLYLSGGVKANNGLIGTSTSLGSSIFTVYSNNAQGLAIGYGTGTNEYRRLYHHYTGLYFESSTNQAYLSAAGAWTNASDVTLKKDIEDIDYGIETVKSLKPRKYKMKSDDEAQIGFIAQELFEEVPEIVGGKEGLLGVSYGQLTAVLTKAIQEQQTLIESLTSRIAALEE